MSWPAEEPSPITPGPLGFTPRQVPHQTHLEVILGNVTRGPGSYRCTRTGWITCVAADDAPR